MTQYQLVIVNLDPTIGSEIKKTRPCIIVSPNEMNEVLNTVIIVPVTSNTKTYPTRIPINQDSVSGMIALDQIRTIDKKRIVIQLGLITLKTSAEIKRLLNEMLVR